MHLLIDADIVAYTGAFTSEREGYTEDQAVEAMDTFIKEMITDLDGTSWHLYLTGKGNFRYKVAVTQPYKGNRKDTPKPQHLQLLRDHIIDRWPSTVCDGEEADDGLGKAQAKDGTTCICSTDKDLDQIAGWHYNWRHHQMYYVRPEEGMRFFYAQMLTGDRADNIKGLYRVGPKTAEKLLDGLTPDECKKVVEQKYQEEYGEQWEDRLKENAQLLWIRRSTTG